MNKVSRAVVATAMAAAGLMSGATTAHAHASTVEIVLTNNGEWKTYAFFHTGTGRLCVRAYHANASAGAVVVVKVGNYSADAVDYGGDTANTCTTLTNYRHGDFGTLTADFFGSGGIHLKDQQNFYA